MWRLSRHADPVSHPNGPVRTDQFTVRPASVTAGKSRFSHDAAGRSGTKPPERGAGHGRSSRTTARKCDARSSGYEPPVATTGAVTAGSIAARWSVANPQSRSARDFNDVPL